MDGLCKRAVKRTKTIETKLDGIEGLKWTVKKTENKQSRSEKFKKLEVDWSNRPKNKQKQPKKSRFLPF